MALNYDVVKNWPIPEFRQTYGARDTILYNLGVGAGLLDSPEEANLDYVWEKQLKAVPTIATILAASDPEWMCQPKSTITWTKMLHGEEVTEWHLPINPSGTVVARSLVDEVYDNGAGRGALLVLQRELYDDVLSRHLATIRSTIFLRADGGFGGKRAPPKSMPAIPTGRAPDLALDQRTRPERALIYRLSGNCYPLHVSPEFARNAGFDRPILHGLAIYGLRLEPLSGSYATTTRRGFDVWQVDSPLLYIQVKR